MSLLYSSSFKYPDGDIRKPQEFSDLNLYSYHQQQPNLLNSSLSRFRSAPSSFFENLFNGDGDSYGGQSGAGVGCEEFRYLRSSSPEMDQLMGRFEPLSNGCGDSRPRDSEELGVRPSIKHEEGEDTQMVYQSLPAHSLGNDNTVSGVGNSMDGTYNRVMNSMDMENSIQSTKMSIGNGTNLVRQNSSPAGIFPDLGIDNGYTMVREAGSFRACNGTNGETSSPTGRLSNHVNFSSGHRILPQIAEMGEGISVNGLDGNSNKREYMTNFTNEFWDDGSSIDFKRAKDNNGNIFSALNTLDNQNGNTTDRVARLSHHWSLPKTMSEMATAEKFLQFQGSVPCKIRAKRGCATHPRSIAERVRRTRISERMRKLQELFPNMDKQTNTADMLDLAVEQIKELQKQVKTLNDTRTSNLVAGRKDNVTRPAMVRKHYKLMKDEGVDVSYNEFEYATLRLHILLPS